jgi:uncharacterized protein (UPF0212 family)
MEETKKCPHCGEEIKAIFSNLCCRLAQVCYIFAQKSTMTNHGKYKKDIV